MFAIDRVSVNTGKINTYFLHLDFYLDSVNRAFQFIQGSVKTCPTVIEHIKHRCFEVEVPMYLHLNVRAFKLSRFMSAKRYYE